jgi:hypothetical protein
MLITSTWNNNYDIKQPDLMQLKSNMCEPTSHLCTTDDDDKESVTSDSGPTSAVPVIICTCSNTLLTSNTFCLITELRPDVDDDPLIIEWRSCFRSQPKLNQFPLARAA